MNIENLEEHKLVFGPMVYIYWIYNGLTITSFNNTSINFHISNNPNLTDSIIFPKLTDISEKELLDTIKVILDLIDHSAKTYNGERKEFTAYFLLQIHYGENPKKSIESLEKDNKNINITHVGETKTAGISFYKYEINVRKD